MGPAVAHLGCEMGPHPVFLCLVYFISHKRQFSMFSAFLMFVCLSNIMLFGSSSSFFFLYFCCLDHDDDAIL